MDPRRTLWKMLQLAPVARLSAFLDDLKTCSTLCYSGAFKHWYNVPCSVHKYNAGMQKALILSSEQKSSLFPAQFSATVASHTKELACSASCTKAPLPGAPWVLLPEQEHLSLPYGQSSSVCLCSQARTPSTITGTISWLKFTWEAL